MSMRESKLTHPTCQRLTKVAKENLGWEDPTPEYILCTGCNWKSELKRLSQQAIPRCYIATQWRENELHGLRRHMLEWSICRHHVTLVAARTKAPPLKKPKPELCGALTVTKLIQHAREILDTPKNGCWGEPFNDVKHLAASW